MHTAPGVEKAVVTMRVRATVEGSLRIACMRARRVWCMNMTPSINCKCIKDHSMISRESMAATL